MKTMETLTSIEKILYSQIFVENYDENSVIGFQLNQISQIGGFFDQNCCTSSFQNDGIKLFYYHLPQNNLNWLVSGI